MITGVSKAVVLVDDQDEVRAAWSGHVGVGATLQGARRLGALDLGGPASSVPEPGGVGASHGPIERLDALADRPGALASGNRCHGSVRSAGGRRAVEWVVWARPSCRSICGQPGRARRSRIK